MCSSQLNKLVGEKLSGVHSTRLLAGLLGDVLVAARRIRELIATTAPPQQQQQQQQQQLGVVEGKGAAGGADGTASVVVKLLKLALDPLEQQVGWLLGLHVHVQQK